eukprot:3936610-Rhodomonas_salina.1
MDCDAFKRSGDTVFKSLLASHIRSKAGSRSDWCRPQHRLWEQKARTMMMMRTVRAVRTPRWVDSSMTTSPTLARGVRRTSSSGGDSGPQTKGRCYMRICTEHESD